MYLYAVLGLKPDATVDEIKRAYRRLARKFHPDVNPGDKAAGARFHEVLRAYETLSDPERRRVYDQTGREPLTQTEVSAGFVGFDFSQTTHGAEAPTFGDLFAEVFARTTERAGGVAPERGADLHVPIAIDFEEAMRGVERPVTVTRAEVCEACRGGGLIGGAARPCQRCGGTGTIRSARGHMVFSKPCADCNGSGGQQATRCRRCGGFGVETRTERVMVRVPPGIADGERVRVPGKGHMGRCLGPAGDLYVSVEVRPHPWFRRDGDDLRLRVPVAVHEAALGAKVDIPTIDGPARLRIPPGTQSGQVFRLRERGAPSVRTGRRGDLVVEVRIVLPALLDERSKELLREFGRLNRDDPRAEFTTTRNANTTGTQ